MWVYLRVEPHNIFCMLYHVWCPSQIPRQYLQTRPDHELISVPVDSNQSSPLIREWWRSFTAQSGHTAIAIAVTSAGVPHKYGPLQMAVRGLL